VLERGVARDQKGTLSSLRHVQVSPRTKLFVLDGRGSKNAVQLARTLRSVGLPRAYVIEVRIGGLGWCSSLCPSFDLFLCRGRLGSSLLLLLLVLLYD
jgi:hypothetical protein